MRAKDYDFTFDRIPPGWLVQKYYDHLEWIAIPAVDNTALLQFPPFDSPGVINKWGICFIDVSATYREVFWRAVDTLAITLRVNEVSVPGYAGLQFPPSSNFEQPALGALWYSCSVFNSSNLVDVRIPIYQNNSTISVLVENLAMADINTRAYARVMGYYVT